MSEQQQAMRMAVVRAGLVENIILVGGDYQHPDQDAQLVEDDGAAVIGGTFEAGQFGPVPIVVDREDLVRQIDAQVAGIYDKPMRLAKEYEARLADAKAYQATYYTGTVPPRVQGFAQPAGMTAKDATDLILAQAAALEDALGKLSDLRMRKYEVRRADTDTQALAVFQEVTAKVAAIGAAIA